MNRLFYFAGHCFGDFVFFCTMRLHQIRPEMTDRPGPFILALTHLGHLDPFLSCVLIRRPIRWMTRREFFEAHPILAWLLRFFGAFSVNRQGIPVSAIRRAIELARGGEIVGICPEGGRVWGKESAMRGGAIKQGVCSVSIRSGTAIVPCVMIGAQDLNCVGPWLPFKRAKLWIAYGEPIHPPPGRSTRASRHALRDQLGAAYVQLYGELREQFNLDDAKIP